MGWYRGPERQGDGAAIGGRGPAGFKRCLVLEPGYFAGTCNRIVSSNSLRRLLIAAQFLV